MALRRMTRRRQRRRRRRRLAGPGSHHRGYLHVLWGVQISAILAVGW